ncbi:MAG: magnesium transporter [Candidatus Thermoplasmatota archaeon]|nr:magnesium transporter [Candidatus Thermoplasmatota archaeon]
MSKQRFRKSITKRILRESLLIFFVLVIIDFSGGSILATLSSAFETVPGLILIIPPLLDLRGNINGALGARLGSAFHLGLVNTRNIFNREVRENLKASLMLSALLSLFAGFFACCICIVFGFAIEPFKVIIITFTAGSLAGLLLTVLTVLIVFIAVKRRADPDNVTTPAIATIGDLLTIVCISAVVALLEKIW